MLNSFYQEQRSNYDIFNQQSLHNELKRSLRATQGFPAWVFNVNGGEDEQQFLANLAGLKGDDRRNEQKLSDALAKLLQANMEILRDLKDTFPDGELGDDAKMASCFCRAILKLRSAREAA